MEPRSARRSLKVDGVEIAGTPLVVPSFSSKVLGPGSDKDRLAETVARIGGIIVGPILVSAYDPHLGLLDDGHGRPALASPLTFIDSGGYETHRIAQEGGRDQPRPVGYGTDEHLRAIAGWPIEMPAVVVNFDTYSGSLERQIEAAVTLCPGRSVGRLLLLKPEREGLRLIEIIRQVGDNAATLSKVDAVGVTEKEAGTCLRERLQTIAALRGELDRCGFREMPIHVFGGLDPVRTPLYFLAGADIFDGLSWLRYGYDREQAVYLDAHASFAHPDVAVDEAEWLVRRANYFETTRMQTNMLRFLATGDPDRLHRRAREMLALVEGCREMSATGTGMQ